MAGSLSSLKALGSLLLRGAKATKNYAVKAGTYVDDLVTSGARSRYANASKNLADDLAAELAEANVQKSISQDVFDRLRQVYNRALTGQIQTYNATQKQVVDALTTGQIEDIITTKLPGAEREILKWNNRIADINKAYKDAGDNLLKQLAKDKRAARVLAYGGTGVGLTGVTTAPIVLSKSSDTKPDTKSGTPKNTTSKNTASKDTANSNTNEDASTIGYVTPVGLSGLVGGGLGAFIDDENPLRGGLIGGVSAASLAALATYLHNNSKKS